MAELLSLTSLYKLLGVLAVLGAVIWAARRAIGSASREAAGAGDERREGLLNKAAAVPEPADAQLCAICKGPLAGAEGACRRLRPCGHVYHAECIDLWLERKRVCPLCRAAVVAARTEAVDAIV